MTEHPINPSPELVQHWIDQSFRAINRYRSIATLAAQWGADTELEECCKLLELSDDSACEYLRAARRKSPSLKKQALSEVAAAVAGGSITHERGATIRLALEALPDD